jgi:YD repeat-containing protein
VSSTSPAGTTTYTWSEGTRTRTTVAPAGTSTQQFDPSGNLLVERSTTGGATDVRFDALSREVATEDPAGSVTRYTYDASGQVVLATADDGSVLRRQYDALNRMIRSATQSNVTLTRYDLVGNTTQTGDGTGAGTTYTYDKIWLHDANGRHDVLCKTSLTTCRRVDGLWRRHHRCLQRHVAPRIDDGRRQDDGLLV